MRNTKILFVSILILFISFCNRNSEKAKQYNNAIALEMKFLADLEKEIALKDGPELDAAIDRFKKAVPDSKVKIEKLGNFEGNDSLLNSALAVCNFYQEVIDGKWSSKGQEAIQNRDEELDKDLQKKQLEFASKFNFKIGE
ncbi:MAG: hypothetical protein KBF99_04075 [Leptospiraceae bacterium]|nr:hypothetical protein [Leptospiraceae bacterium]MBK9499652.1 hypothetical protein [Leptospiraceae bacterium]MBL0262309.1 hypothetical protein [Leptospiraceae bacterium]MBP9162331.1 hypothetical protein [Leptospiraceae bacterium]HRG45572.1 hypothetical protein [Leptospiraceae bacterium]